ncbi:MAG TPA: HD domain-containing protein [Moraxellaceae bacterium]
MDSALLQRQLAFILELEKLKQVLRKTRPLGLSRYENSAEHSWQVALMAVTLVEYAHEPVDLDRVIKLLLVHDIAEIDVGDTIVYAASRVEGIAEKDLRAAQRIFGLLPEAQGAELLALWKEYESRETAEARFAQAMDRLMPVLHNLNNGGQSWRENGISKQQVLEKNAKIGEGAPELWRWLLGQIETAHEKGWLR